MSSKAGGITALYPGSFDPLHNGHLAIIEQAAARFDRVVVAVLANPAKQGFWPMVQRLDAIAAATAHLPNVEAVHHDGLTVDAAAAVHADVVVRAWAKEYQHEFAMAAMNAGMSGIETVFVPGTAATAGISSSLVRSLVAAHRPDDVRPLVPPAVFAALAR